MCSLRLNVSQSEMCSLRLNVVRFAHIEKLCFSKSFIVSRTVCLWDVFEHHVKFVFRVVGELQKKKSVEGVVEVRVDVETQEL